MTNRLGVATSPYLLQHRDNPVHWREWSDATLAEARDLQRPILLSIGYAACHWCHVMAHESFEKDEIADLMNRWFVNIKVDREERPDLDAIYQQALALLGEQGGWPLTMFLTPNGEPFWGGTYFPPEPRWGRPSFTQVLQQISTLWRAEQDKIASNRDALADAMQRMATTSPGDPPGPSLALAAAERLVEEIDAVHGGIGTAPKFPQAPALNLLWQASLVGPSELIRQRVVHTLARICQGGIYDHLGGGFARYSVDAFWLVPHFEKMLYDNAQLLELLGEAWVVTGNPLFRARALETVAWLNREMLVDGAFAASLDADSEGEEGKFYVWDATEIETILGADADRLKLAYGVTRTGNWEKTNVLNRLHEPGLPPVEDEPFLERCRQKLLDARAKRPRPGLDDKLLADWNGLAIAALARAGSRFGETAWIQMAKHAFDAVVERMTDGDRLVHSYRRGRRLELAFLDDYAQLMRAALALLEVDGDPAYLDRALRWLAIVDQDYGHESGGYYMTPADTELVVRPCHAHDGPSPAAAATIAIESARLACLTGDDRHRARAQTILEAYSGEVRRNPLAHATMLQAAMFHARPLQVVVVGERDEPGTAAMIRALANLPMPIRAAMIVSPEAALPAGHPASAKQRDGRGGTAYVCAGPTCLAPATTPNDLAARVREAMAMGQRRATRQNEEERE